MKRSENDISTNQGFTDFICAVGSEIEHAQVKLISAANVQMLLHYMTVTNMLNEYEFAQQPAAQIQLVELEVDKFGQQVVAQIKDVSKALVQITQEQLKKMGS